MGGRSFGPGRVTSMVKLLIIANAVVYALSLVYIHWVPPQDQVGPLLAYLVLYPPTFLEGQLWQLVTYMFLHSFDGPFHLLFNMFVLWMFGSLFEPQWGQRRFLFYYLACGIGGGVAVVLCYLLFPSVAMFQAPVLGASAATLALIIAFGVLHPEQYVYLFFAIPVKARYVAVAVVVGDVVVNFFGMRIASHAHLGGMLTGWLLITGYWDPRRWGKIRERYREKQRQAETRRRFRESMRD